MLASSQVDLGRQAGSRSDTVKLMNIVDLIETDLSKIQGHQE